MELPRRPNPSDNALFVEFFDGEYGPNRVPMPFVKIVVDGFTESCFPIKNELESQYVSRFPDAWKIYKEKATEQKVGIPLIEMPKFTPTRVKAYAMQDIFSVEQLVACSDARLERIMGGRADRKAAVEFLEKRTKEKESEKTNALSAQMEAQAKQIAEQQAMIEKLMAAQAKTDKKENKEK